MLGLSREPTKAQGQKDSIKRAVLKCISKVWKYMFLLFPKAASLLCWDLLLKSFLLFLGARREAAFWWCSPINKLMGGCLPIMWKGRSSNPSFTGNIGFWRFSLGREVVGSFFISEQRLEERISFSSSTARISAQTETWLEYANTGIEEFLVGKGHNKVPGFHKD